MDLVTLLNNLVASLSALQAQLSDAKVAAQSAFDAGFKAGVASVVPVVGPSQADLDAALAKVADLESKVSGLQAQVDAFPASLVAAVALVKAGAKQAVVNFEAKEEATVAEALAAIEAL